MTSRSHPVERAVLALTLPLAVCGAVAVAAPSGASAATSDPAPTPTPTVTIVWPAMKCDARLAPLSVWDGGYVTEVVVMGGPHGTGSWVVRLHGAEVAHAWNTVHTDDGLGSHRMRNTDWNGNVLPYREYRFGYVGVGSPDDVRVSCTPVDL